jgi:hypothetical protein
LPAQQVIRELDVVDVLGLLEFYCCLISKMATLADALQVGFAVVDRVSSIGYDLTCVISQVYIGTRR